MQTKKGAPESTNDDIKKQLNGSVLYQIIAAVVGKLERVSAKKWFFKHIVTELFHCLWILVSLQAGQYGIGR